MPNNWPSVSTNPDEIIANTVVRALLGAIGQRGSKERMLTLSFIRLTAKALVEYSRAADADTAAHGLTNSSKGLESMGAIENCVLSLHRSLLFLDALRMRGVTKADGTALSLKPASLPVMATDTRARILALRDAISHMDERIAEGTYPVGTPIALGAHDNVLELEGTVVHLSELARWLDQVGGIAKMLAVHGVARGSRLPT